MREYLFEATLMVPIIHKVKAMSIRDAENQINRAYDIDKDKSCAKDLIQPFIHSMKIVSAEEIESDIA